MESSNEKNNTLIHISHLHPLKLMDSHENKPICHACHQPCLEQSYGCHECSYFLHTTCALFKRKLDHPSHPAHTLKLLLTPDYNAGGFSCNACVGNGYTLCFNCKECQFDLHLSCASLPEELIHQSHPHPLELIYENPYPEDVETLCCDLCEESMNILKWFYLCRECDFGGHVDCFTDSEVAEERLRRRNEQAAQQQAGNISTQMIQLFQMQQTINSQRMALQSMNQQTMNSQMRTLEMKNDLTMNMIKNMRI